MARARITTHFPEYSVALARCLRSQGFEVHTCAPGEQGSKTADLEITLKPCAQEDRQAALDQHGTDKDMFVVVSPGVEARNVRSIEMVVLRPRAELEAARQKVTPAQVIVMSMASFQGNGFSPQRAQGRWERIHGKVTGVWEMTCALCWHVSKATREQVAKIRAALRKQPPVQPKEIPTRDESRVDPELVPSMFGLSSEALGSATTDFVPVEFAPNPSWREPIIAFCVRRWGIVASAIAIGLVSLVLPQLWHSNAESQPASIVQPAGVANTPAAAALAVKPAAALAKASAEVGRKLKFASRTGSEDELEASFGSDVTVRHFPRTESRGPAHPTHAVARRVVVN